MAYQTFRQEYLQVPPVTRAYTTACVLTTAAVVSARPREGIGSGVGAGWPWEGSPQGPPSEGIPGTDPVQSTNK